MIDKVYTKEQRYIMRMEKEGYARKAFWVHTDDYEKVKTYAHKLRSKRIKLVASK